MAKGNIRALVEVGILLASVSLGAADVQAKKPLPSIFPPIDPSRVDCTAFRTGNEGQCYRTANEVYQLNLLILNIDFTVVDDEHGGTVRIIRDAQTELFRRNPQMPRGWELVYEQIGYITPLRGEQ